MVYDPSDRRAPYRSPEVVLAEARRIAADIRRRAERDANELRREAAEWAAATRRDAERYRDRVLAELAHAAEGSRSLTEAHGHEEPPPGRPRGEVIDLRSRAEARGTPMTGISASEGDGTDGDADVADHPAPMIETSIDTKVNDVVRHAVRRTFDRDEPDAITGR